MSTDTGWVCPRCGKVWAPSVKSCDCEPKRPGYVHDPVPFWAWPPYPGDPMPPDTHITYC